ncbi:Fe-S cluster assembly protein SufD [Candidatus Methylocalor cossyra]
MDHAERFRSLRPQLPGRELHWLEQLRDAAEHRFATSGFPSSHLEEWKYTPRALIERQVFQPAGPDAAPVDAALVERYRLTDAWVLVFVDGRFASDHSWLEGLPEGVAILPLATALQACPEQVAARFQRLAGKQDHGLVAFTTAYFRDGVFLRIPAGATLTRPVQLLHLASRAGGLRVLRHLVLLECHAEARVVETYAGVEGAEGLTAAITEIELGENAALEHYKLQVEGPRSYHFGGIYAELARSARLRQHQGAFGGLWARTDIHGDLGQGTECRLDGLFLATGQRQLDTHTRIRHTAPYGVTRETYRGIATERGRGVFTGRIVVEQEAQKTDAEMNNRNLLLSDGAEIDSRPQLEIHADDVKCSHGVAVGQLDPDAVFYLESRGIGQDSARQWLTFAFAKAMLENIDLDELRRQEHAALLTALPQAESIGEWP